MLEGWMDTRGGGVASLPYKECPILFLQQDIEDQMVQQEQSDHCGSTHNIRLIYAKIDA